MVPPPVLAHDLACTWLDGRVGFFSTNGTTAEASLSESVRHLLGAHRSVALDERRDLDLSHRAAFASEALSVLPVDAGLVAEGLIDRRPHPNWPASVAWLHRATEIATQIVRSGRVLPSVRPRGIRWSATWSVVSDSAVDEQLAWLLEIAPPVILAAGEDPPAEQVRALIGELVDAIARAELTDLEWKAPLARSRSSAVVALRRIVGALTSEDRVFIGDSPAHESAFAEWSTALSDAASRLAGGPVVSFQGRLIAPALDEPLASWMLVLEVVGANGEVASFRDVWDGTASALEVVEPDSLGSLRVRMRDLIERLSGQLALFESLADEPEPTAFSLHIDEVSELLDGSMIACRRAGLPIVTPSSMMSQSARLTARVASAADFPSSQVDRGLISVDWGVALGDLDLSEAELQELADSKAEIVALRGGWVQIDRGQLSSVLDEQRDRQQSSAELTASELLRESVAALGQSPDDVSAEGWIATLLAGLPDDELTESLEPTGFDGELRHYQRRALAWLQFLGRIGLGGCLADDMGLGKTPTALAHLLARTQEMRAGNKHRIDGEDTSSVRPHLVICPLSVVSNWKSEAHRFTPELSVFIAHGPTRPQGQELVEISQAHDLVITTYGTIARIAEDLAAVEWDVVVFDEAQLIKNHATNAARSVRLLDATQKIALTGTPVENRLTELWSILDALNPSMLGGITWFRSTFAAPIEATGDAAKIESLKRITAPFVLRRTKADRSLVPDLPEKIEMVAWATLTKEQAALYQAVVDDFFVRLREADGMERRGLVLATLTKLKQVCNHPAQFLREAQVGTGRSGKLDRFDELVESILEAEERVLVFTQYRAMGHLLANHVQSKFGIESPFLHGGTSRSGRDAMVDAFQSQDGPPIQLVSLRAGGTGLNLTSASRVIHYDRWWNPAVEDQATDRTWRIGQTETVLVHKLVCQGTLEDRIDSLLTEKRALAEAVVGTGDNWLTEMSTDELRMLVRLDTDLAGES